MQKYSKKSKLCKNTERKTESCNNKVETVRLSKKLSKIYKIT